MRQQPLVVHPPSLSLEAARLGAAAGRAGTSEAPSHAAAPHQATSTAVAAVTAAITAAGAALAAQAATITAGLGGAADDYTNTDTAMATTVPAGENPVIREV
ncbi:hypothetical protein [Mycobacterium talmoniae]|uniref:Uncharacterized protein n=1 Tax=Mycobacterium talmoniae TaxID=1858794 RepID=A0A1S1ND23_9MYCO|nr:hypothetical protein [Mycobacterium talmoniae]OHV03520.1 hypothetical protein BKN37_14450 [Mycobacterium talmoniae]